MWMYIDFHLHLRVLLSYGVPALHTLAPSSEGLRSPNAPDVFIAISTLNRLCPQHLQPPFLVRSSALKYDGEWFYVVSVTYSHIKMVHDTDNKKELDMRRTELLLRLSGTDTLRYGEFHR